MEGRESGGPPPFNSFSYHRGYAPNANANANANPNPNSHPHPANAIFAGGGPDSARSLSSSAAQPITIAATATATTTTPDAFSAPLYSECPTAIFAHPISGRLGVGVARSDTLKRKRGRPRKYGSDGDGYGTAGLGLSPLSAAPASPSFFDKKGRGSGKKAQMAALGSAGQGFTPHVITVAAGEDVSKKIMAFMQHGSLAVCVLSANGAISNATLRQPAMSGGFVTYEGRFEILSLSGSFLNTEVGGTYARTGGLSVSLAGPDGRVVGGGVGGLLMAASPVQVVVGTFLVDNKRDPGRVGNGEPSIGTLSGSISGGSPSPVAVQSRTEISGGTNTGKGSHGEQNTGGSNYNLQPQVLNMMSLQMDWVGPHFEADTKSDSDTVQAGRTKPRDQDDNSQSYKGDEEEEIKDQNITFEN